jgi:type I restriction enzyme R subunit
MTRHARVAPKQPSASFTEPDHVARRSSSSAPTAEQELQLETLSSIVEQLNDRFGTDFTDTDKLLFDQFEAEWIADGELSDQAQSNTIENFALAFGPKFMSTIVTRMDANSEIFKKILDNDDFSEFVRDVYLKKFYEQLREAA